MCKIDFKHKKFNKFKKCFEKKKGSNKNFQNIRTKELWKEGTLYGRNFNMEELYNEQTLNRRSFIRKKLSNQETFKRRNF